LREAYWDALQSNLKAAPKRMSPVPYDPFGRSVALLLEGYDYLPAIGAAAQAGYAGGTFNPGPFFNATSTVHEKPVSVVHIIAGQNAAAVLEVEAAVRAAWIQGHPAPP
jgi:hypothetical protein